ncbi:MAG: PilZ domain-containing protein [Bdellovibrionaceae bacterium]|nr:PilZ domain-containing protein [Pseudobdellovibrionaceae bacterium]
MLVNTQGIESRKFPRKDYNRPVGILFSGFYQKAEAIEISEGGMSFRIDVVLTVDRECVMTFKVPKGKLVCLRAVVKHMKKDRGQLIVGVAFKEVPFSNKRQIRNFIADRS